MRDASSGFTVVQLELGDRTVRRYVAGDSPIPRVVELAVIYLLQMYRAR